MQIGPDARFPAGCEVWAATQHADRPDETPRPARDHVALGRRLAAPGGAMAGTPRAAVADDRVVGALRLLLPVRDHTAVAYLDLAVHPAARRRGVGSAVRNGRLVAYTELHVPLEQLARAQQGAALVRHEHHGHRPGARVKIAVLRELAATLPQVRRISTYDAESNRPMVAVNEAPGFRRAGGLSAWTRRP